MSGSISAIVVSKQKVIALNHKDVHNFNRKLDVKIVFLFLLRSTVCAFLTNCLMEVFNLFFFNTAEYWQTVNDLKK